MRRRTRRAGTTTMALPWVLAFSTAILLLVLQAINFDFGVVSSTFRILRTRWWIYLTCNRYANPTLHRNPRNFTKFAGASFCVIFVWYFFHDTLIGCSVERFTRPVLTLDLYCACFFILDSLFRLDLTIFITWARYRPVDAGGSAFVFIDYSLGAFVLEAIHIDWFNFVIVTARALMLIVFVNYKLLAAIWLRPYFMRLAFMSAVFDLTIPPLV